MPTITRTPIVDDDLTGTVGTVLDNAWKQELYGQIDAVIAAVATSSGVQTTTLTGTQNNFALTAGVGVLRCNNASQLTITGFSAGADGQWLAVYAVGAARVVTQHEAAGSSAANRLVNFSLTVDTPGTAGAGVFLYRYDGTTQRWRLIQHEQGAWIAWTPTWTTTGTAPSLGDGGFTAAYKLRGREVHFRMGFSYGSTTTAGTGAWSFSLPFTAQSSTSCVVLIRDASPSGTYSAVALISGAVLTPFESNAGASAGLTGTAPMTWAVNDFLIAAGLFDVL